MALQGVGISREEKIGPLFGTVNHAILIAQDKRSGVALSSVFHVL